VSDTTGRQSHDVARLWEFTRRTGHGLALKALHERNVWRTSRAILWDWTLIVASLWLANASTWLLVPGLLVIGNRQRALVVLTHDASHRLLARRPRVNDTIARLFLCWPMFISLAHYRKLHVEHHRHLGDPKKDTDYLHDEQLARRGWWALYERQLLGLRNLRTALLGQLPKAQLPERASILTLWGGVLGVMYAILGGAPLLSVLSLWLAARVLVYHPIISFVIISDHVGLSPGTVMGFTRNHPAGVRSWLLHPHANGWHLTHHLLPGVPCHNLECAHVLLMNWPEYAAAEHCDRYIIGRRSVLQSWTRCVRP
jgi:fatty acid desaturase